MVVVVVVVVVVVNVHVVVIEVVVVAIVPTAKIVISNSNMIVGLMEVKAMMLDVHTSNSYNISSRRHSKDCSNGTRNSNRSDMGKWIMQLKVMILSAN